MTSKTVPKGKISSYGVCEKTQRRNPTLFLAHNFLVNHMGIEGIEVMRAHRTNVKERAAASAKPGPIHVYLLRYG